VTALPTGTLTMLFSDIEGSTVLLHRLGAAWGEALSAQRRIMRNAFEPHGGTEMGTEGDSFFVVFSSARSALQAAVDAQRALAGEDWPGNATVRVRMGLHTGEPERHEDGYIGSDVHRAARIGATAHGGQIVVSAATRALAGRLPGIAFRDLGRHRLKDFAEPEPLFDVLAPGLAEEFPPLRSPGRVTALPSSPTPLVGRERELRELAELLGGGRLVTLTGPGGSGKTRLAVAAATEAGHRCPDGVWFAGLSSAADETAFWTQLGDVLDAPASADVEPAAAVLDHLAPLTALLVLDNLEHIGSADLAVARLLDAAPQLTILTTSRRPLLLAAEREYPVEPLAVPTGSDADAVASSPAVALFVQQARAVRPAFALDDGNRADVAELCRRLDGLPLALELAAAHQRLLSPHALLSRIDSRLGSGVTAADRPQRQRSLGAAIAWSYDLLDDADRATFRRLGVFRSPADLDAVAAVAMIDGGDVIAAANRLVGTSLVRVVTGSDGEPRLALLETIRNFALERLQAESDGSDESATRRRHLRWSVEATERAVGRLRGPLHPRALDELAAIEDDVRAALDYALQASGPADPERLTLGHRLLIAISTRYWYPYGSVAEARGWQERGLRLADDTDRAATFWLLHGLGMSLVQNGEAGEAETLFDRALEMAQRMGDGALETRALNDLAIVRRQAGRDGEARALLHRALEVATAADVASQSLTLGNLAVVCIDAGDHAGAADAVRQAMEIDAAAGNLYSLAVNRLNYTATILRAEGAPAALNRYRGWSESVLAFRENQLTIDLIEVGAAVAAGLGAAATAARLLAAADAHRARDGIERSPQERTMLQDWLAPARQALSADEWETTYASGAELSAARAVEEVNALTAPARSG
jgi:predicted ATPase/class 3 adenylate cyclase